MGDLPADIADEPEERKGKEGDDEMVVVVPPAKSAKLAGDAGKEEDGDIAMEGTQQTEAQTSEEDKVDPVARTISGQLPN